MNKKNKLYKTTLAMRNNFNDEYHIENRKKPNETKQKGE